jgi:O-methyltransferase
MSTKDAVNSAVAKVSGYHLTKRKPGEAESEIKEQGEKILSQRAKIQTLKDEIAATSAAARQRPEFPSDFDESSREIIRAVRAYTMTGVDKLHALISATRYVAQHNIPGDVVECGVWRGGSMQAVARALIEAGDATRNLYLFDTFDELPASSSPGTAQVTGTVDDVRAGFASVPYPAEQLHFIKGKVADTVPAQVPEQIAILRLDADGYEATAHELTHMWDRLSSGGVLLIDDYGQSKGSRQATDEFLERTGARLLLVRVGSGRVAVKP